MINLEDKIPKEKILWFELIIEKKRKNTVRSIRKWKKVNIEVTICEKILYNYINSGLFLNINKSHIPCNKKDKLMKPTEKSKKYIS